METTTTRKTETFVARINFIGFRKSQRKLLPLARCSRQNLTSVGPDLADGNYYNNFRQPSKPMEVNT
jgi:hypothetical protein